jgi:hypothetical protein
MMKTSSYHLLKCHTDMVLSFTYLRKVASYLQESVSQGVELDGEHLI